ncbi:SDR family NAD(P)-dependent oxidoreductase [Streptomyces sp. NPDC055060]
MHINGARILIAGASGAIGSALAAELGGRGARLALAGRDPDRLAQVAAAHPSAATALFDAYAPDSCARAVHSCAAALGGLDAVITAFGAVAFGATQQISDAAAEHLAAVNTLAPAAFLRAALGLMQPGATIAAVTGVVAERPQPGMADYSASKAALSAWLDAVRRETRAAGIHVLDVRFGHLDTGFADRAVEGTAPPMPPAGNLQQAVRTLVQALHSDAELVRAAPDGTQVIQQHAR